MTNKRQAQRIGTAVSDAQTKKRSGRKGENNKARDGIRTEDKRISEGGRVPLGSGMNLSLPDSVLEDIKEKDLFPYWAKNDHSIQQFFQAGYERYVDSEGNEYERATKDGEAKHVLLVQPMKYHREDLELQRRTSEDNIIDAAQRLESGQYIPPGRTYAVEKDKLPNR